MEKLFDIIVKGNKNKYKTRETIYKEKGSRIQKASDTKKFIFYYFSLITSKQLSSRGGGTIPNFFWPGWFHMPYAIRKLKIFLKHLKFDVLPPLSWV